MAEKPGHRSKSVKEIDPKTGNVLNIYPSARRAAAAIYCDQTTICRACNGGNSSHPGIIFNGLKYQWA